MNTFSGKAKLFTHRVTSTPHGLRHEWTYRRTGDQLVYYEKIYTSQLKAESCGGGLVKGMTLFVLIYLASVFVIAAETGSLVTGMHLAIWTATLKLVIVWCVDVAFTTHGSH